MPAPQGFALQVRINMERLENIAAEIFRHVSHQVKGTPLDIHVDPYTISLTETPDTTGSKALAPDPAITKDVEAMWFYEKQKAF